ncbi:MAG: ABC transporter ATP-binding protein [Actinomycetota bacterium]|nr:ABC transporter ATP-binding protein [Actinomycetota bacterium]
MTATRSAHQALPTAEPIIVADGVRKVFRTHAQHATSLKERVLRRTSRTGHVDFVALADVTASIAPGSTVGLIGPNGAGKSTLLKVLAGILLPTTGTVKVRGRVASLLELGAGFNGELTGRENVYLNASLLGLSRKETDTAMDSIVDFSELSEFIDQPVKHYSSGMYVRLGFAVAIHVDPDILLVDEVLAVGDESFQRKCMEKIHAFQEAGKTILFVSHSLGQVEELCTRAIVLDHGVMVDDADPASAVETLRKIMGTDEPPAPVAHTPDVGFIFGEVVASLERGGPAVAELGDHQDIWIRSEFTVDDFWANRIAQVHVVAMGAFDYPLFRVVAERADLPTTAGSWQIDFHLPVLPQLFGRFRLGVQVVDDDDQPLAHTRSRIGYALDNKQGPALLPVRYSIESVSGK